MKTKLVINNGLAFSEGNDLRKLEELAAKGWHLKEFTLGGLFYKLVKGTPQNIDYSIDYQANPDTDYLKLFKEANWEHVISCGKVIHIFKALKGTPPIYNNSDSEMDKYEEGAKWAGKGALISSILMSISLISMVLSLFFVKQLFLLFGIIALISFITFIFSFMPFIAYKRTLRGDFDPNSNNKSNTTWRNLYFILGIVNISVGFINYTSHLLYVAIICTLIGVLCIMKTIQLIYRTSVSS